MARTSSIVGVTGVISTSVTDCEFNTPTSRAKPLIPKQSPRFAVKSTSMVTSFKSK